MRRTAELARRFAEPFGAGPLAEALGLWHDAGKADCGWQQRLLDVEGTDGPVGGNHKSLGARVLRSVAGPMALAIEGHHGGLPDVEALTELTEGDGDQQTLHRFYEAVPEARALATGPVLVPAGWRRDPLVAEMGLRLVFSALVDADHLDTAAHFACAENPVLAPDTDMAGLAARFEETRRRLLSGRLSSPVDEVREKLYQEVVGKAPGPLGIYKLPAPTGAGKTITGAGFALHHAAHNRQRRVIIAVPLIAITEQNAEVYRTLLGKDVVLEHHSNAELDDDRARLGAENWDAPVVVTTTVQLFDSLFGRKPARSRKLHRLAGAVIVLDEVQLLPMPLLAPILDALKVLVEHFRVTVVLTSATQPAFETLGVWRSLRRRPVCLVEDPAALFTALRRVDYRWSISPRPQLEEVAGQAAEQDQALVVVNTVDQARRFLRLLDATGAGHVWHLSTRMCQAHRRDVLARIRAALAEGDPIQVVSTQLIEAGVDVDFPTVFRALAPAESLQQAAGRANREGRRPEGGQVVVFDAADTTIPAFYRTAVGICRVHFGPGVDKADPDNVDALDSYYRHLYQAIDLDHAERGRTIQDNRARLRFQAVADGPLRDGGAGAGRDAALAFRMLDDDTVPVVVTGYRDTDHVTGLLDQIRATHGARRDLFRALQPYLVSLPRHLVTDPALAALCRPVVGEHGGLLEWCGDYDQRLGIDEGQIGKDSVW
ncbi:CRISPR-associated helicase/endonuclease Cas3 [Kutzneria viridogrisea]